jgi:hypothetical protein
MRALVRDHSSKGSARFGFVGAGASNVDSADEAVFGARLENFRDQLTASDAGECPALAKSCAPSS